MLRCPYVCLRASLHLKLNINVALLILYTNQLSKSSIGPSKNILKIEYFSSVALQTTHIWINLLGQIFATRNAVAPLSNIMSCWADQYGSRDTSNTNIRPLETILWQNI